MVDLIAVVGQMGHKCGTVVVIVVVMVTCVAQNGRREGESGGQLPPLAGHRGLSSELIYIFRTSKLDESRQIMSKCCQLQGANTVDPTWC